MDGHDGGGGHGGHGHGHGSGHGQGHGGASLDNAVLLSGNHGDFIMVNLGGSSHGGGHASMEAMVLSHSFSAGASHGAAHMSHVSSHGGAHGHGLSGYGTVGMGNQRSIRAGNNDRRFDPVEPKCPDNPDQRSFVDHVVAHGSLDVMMELARLAPQLDLIRLDTIRPNMDSVDMVKIGIADWDAWSTPYSGKVMPHGYYPGATGRTILERQYWQVGIRDKSWTKYNPVKFDRKAMTFLQIDLTQWDYFEAGDFETKFEVRIVSLPVFDPYSQSYGIRKAALERHQKGARLLVQMIFDSLSNMPPHPVAVASRERIYCEWEKQGHKDDPPIIPDGDFEGRPTTPEEDAAHDQAGLDEVIKHDAGERVNDPRTGKDPGPPPPGDTGGDEELSLVSHVVSPHAVPEKAPGSGADLHGLFGAVPEDSGAAAQAIVQEIAEERASDAVTEAVEPPPAKVAVVVVLPA